MIVILREFVWCAFIWWIIFTKFNPYEICKQYFDTNISAFCFCKQSAKNAQSPPEKSGFNRTIFGRKINELAVKNLDIRRGDIKTEPYTSMTYLACILDNKAKRKTKKENEEKGKALFFTFFGSGTHGSRGVNSFVSRDLCHGQ